MTSNNLESSSEISRMTRPRRLYLTSEQVRDFTDASSCVYSMKEIIRSEEGFNLAYGVKSFGYTASAHNISSRQQNNVLKIRYTYAPARLISVYNETAESNIWIENPDTEDVTKEYLIYINDGLYSTHDELYSELSSLLNYFIPSGILADVESPRNLEEENILLPNIVPIRLDFVSSNNGYTLSPFLGINGQVINNVYIDPIHSESAYQAYQVNVQPKTLEILPHESAPALYNLLFFNDAFTETHPPQCPSFISPASLHNPPPSIVFTLQNYLSFIPPTSGNLTDPVPVVTLSELQTISPQDSLKYKIFSSADSDLAEQVNAEVPTIPSTMWNYPFRSFFIPRINPMYLDVKSNLETLNLTDTGTMNGILIRHFITGADAGVQDYYQTWDTPVWHTTMRQTIDSISLNFSSESDLWDFFNMTFFLELVLFEYPEAEEIASYFDQQFVLPTNDPMTAQLDSLIGPVHNRFSRQNDSNNVGVVNRRLNKKLKRY